MENIPSVDTSQHRIIYPNEKKEDREATRQKRLWRRRVPIILAWIAIVLVVVFFVLFISSKVGQFESISEMLNFISQHLS